MPLGASRLAFFTKPQEAAAPEGPLVESTTSMSISYNWDQYFQQKLKYCGDDSSGNPVFVFGYRDDTDTYAKAVLVKVLADGSITEGTPTTFASVNVTTAVAEPEYPDNDYIGVCYIKNSLQSKSYMKVASINLDTLAIGTPGSETEAASSSDAGFALISYLGDSKYAAGARASGISLFLMTRSGTSLTRGTSIFMSTGGAVDNITRAMSKSGSIYRVIGTSGTGNPFIGSGYWNAGSASSTDADQLFTGMSAVVESRTDIQSFAGNKAITVARDGDEFNVTCASVSWPGSGTGAPTNTVGTELELTDLPEYKAFDVTYKSDDTSILIYKNSNTWYWRELTTSGTTVTEGTRSDAISSSILGSADIRTFHAQYLDHAHGEMLVGLVDDSGSTNPNFVVLPYSTPTDYTVPTAAFTSDGNTEFLCSWDGTNGQTSATDESSNSHTITFSGASADLSTTQAKFGTASVDLNFSSTDSIYFGDAGTSAWYNQDTTIECWVYYDTLTGAQASNGLPRVLGSFVTVGGGNYWSFGAKNDGSLQFFYYQGSGNYVTSATGVISAGQWHHIAMVYNHSTGAIRLLCDGFEVASGTKAAGSFSNHGYVRLGNYSGTPDAYVDEIRISHTQRY